MPDVNSQDTLRQIAKQMRSRVSNCEHYDPNVCRYEHDPDNIAKIIAKSGQPFLRRTAFTKDGQKIRLYANDDFFQITLPFEIDADPLSINRKDKIYFLEAAGEVKPGVRSYQVFSRKGILNDNQKALVRKPGFESLVESMNLAAGESLHFYRNGISIYLHHPDTDRVSYIIDLTRTFLGTLSPSPSETNFTGLPPQFKPLIPLIQAWGISDDVERDERREQMSRVVLQALVDEVTPYFGAINSYLDSFGDRPQPEAATALGALAEFVAETDLYLKEKR
jgi:hypothetical protein